MKKHIMIFAVLLGSLAYGQVGINTEEPNPNSLLHVSESASGSTPSLFKGVLIPRYTDSERDNDFPVLGNEDNGLLIYNTDTDCYNYWSQQAVAWMQICGKSLIETAVFICTDVKVNGSYIDNKPLTPVNTIVYTVMVTEEGPYDISYTINGMTFSGNGTLSVGVHDIVLSGTGTPVSTSTPTTTPASSNGFVLCEATINYGLNLTDVKILQLGTPSYGLMPSNVRSFLNASANFGPSGTVKTTTIPNWNTIIENRSGSSDQISEATGAQLLDEYKIIYLSYVYIVNSAEATKLIDFVNGGGILIAATERAGSGYSRLADTVFRNLTGNPTYDATIGGTTNNPIVSGSSSPIVDGHFGNVNGLNFVNNGSVGDYLVGLGSTSEVLAYYSNPSQGMIVKLNGKNVVYSGDGGWTASDVFILSGTTPVTGGPLNSSTSILFANIFAWALEQAVLIP